MRGLQRLRCVARALEFGSGRVACATQYSCPSRQGLTLFHLVVARCCSRAPLVRMPGGVGEKGVIGTQERQGQAAGALEPQLQVSGVVSRGKVGLHKLPRQQVLHSSYGAPSRAVRPACAAVRSLTHVVCSGPAGVQYDRNGRRVTPPKPSRQRVPGSGAGGGGKMNYSDLAREQGWADVELIEVVSIPSCSSPYPASVS